jgi:hypothetical protein
MLFMMRKVFREAGYFKIYGYSLTGLKSETDF